MNKFIPRPLFNSNPKLQALLSKLHTISLAQEAEGYGGSLASQNQKSQGGVIYPGKDLQPEELAQFKEKLVALNEDKASFVNLTLKTMNAQRVFEAGTSFGVSTLYLLEAIRHNRSNFGNIPSGLPSRVWGNEMEPSKAKIAISNILEAFSSPSNSSDEVLGDFQLIEGDVLKVLPEIKDEIQDESIDVLLLDVWAPVALPLFSLLEKKIRRGGVVFVDNSTSGEERYKELNDRLDGEGSGWHNWHSIVVPFRDGFKMAVKTGK